MQNTTIAEGLTETWIQTWLTWFPALTFSLQLCVCFSIFEQWLRRHQPPRTHYPTANAPIGHNDGYYMVPFIPLYRNGDYFLSTKALGYEYAYLQDPSESFAYIQTLSCAFSLSLFSITFSLSGQRFVQEFLTPYLEQAQQIWRWLLAAGILGAVVAGIIAAIITVAFRRRPKRRKSYGERQPLLNSSEEEGSTSYQTTLWPYRHAAARTDTPYWWERDTTAS